MKQPTINDFLGESIIYDREGQMIFAVQPNGHHQLILDVRGWGAIQNRFKNAKGEVDSGLAMKFQDELGQYYADCLNALKGIENPKEFVDQAKERNEFDKQFDSTSEELLKTEEDTDKYLRSQGLDPEEIAKNGVTFVNNLVKRIKGEERIKELETALRGIEQLVDNSNESHEQIWRIAYEALKK